MNSFNFISSYLKNVGFSIIKYIYNFPAIDPSLVLYYPLDTSLNTTVANYASGLPVYDASLSSSTSITTSTNTFVTGVGDVNLNNVMGSVATQYVRNYNSFNLVPSGGLSIACWFSCSGELDRGTLISLYQDSNYPSIELDIISSSTLFSGYIIPAPIGSNNDLTIIDGSNYFTVTNGTTKYYVFTSGTYNISIYNRYVNCLAIGGGGGGGSYFGGGGGAGGISYSSTLWNGNYTITVGNGGISAGNGGSSIVTGANVNINAYGGGYGGSDSVVAYSSSNMGSGGGGSGSVNRTTGGQTSSGQGRNGGTGSLPNGVHGGSGGGGGFVEVGGNSNAFNGGKGGNGTDSYSSTLSIISSQMNNLVPGWITATNNSGKGIYYVAGGGGGSAYYYEGNGQFTKEGIGGLGGGGGGSIWNYPTSGISGTNVVAGFTNTGSGGGGGSDNIYQTGGNGGSGLVIISYTPPN